MMVYLLKSSACLAAFYIFYKAFLEKESMHVLKRFYLLIAPVLSFVIPLITFTEYIEVSPFNAVAGLQVMQADPSLQSEINSDAALLNIPLILWGIYLLGLFMFGIRFLKNLILLGRKIQSNPKERTDHITRVLLSEKISPHTFFRYIFLNKIKYRTKQIPAEVLLHEETHARQKHSADVVFIELLQLLFWFNPLICLFKKTIKLNHEFLADSTVIRHGAAPASYQYMLLTFTRPQLSRVHHAPFANAINYSSIKKRFTVMKAQTSTSAKWVRLLIFLPFITLLLFGFSDKIKIYRSEFPQQIYTQDGATKKQMQEYNALARKYNSMSRSNFHVIGSEVERLEYIYSLMTGEQKNAAEPYPEFPPVPGPPLPPQGTANMEERVLIEKKAIAMEREAAQLEKQSMEMEQQQRQMEAQIIQMEEQKVQREQQRVQAEQEMATVLPTVPQIAVHANTNKYSKELQTAIRKYRKEKKKYQEALAAQSKKRKGNAEDLEPMYGRVMELYRDYETLAQREDTFIAPVPPASPVVSPVPGNHKVVPAEPTSPEAPVIDDSPDNTPPPPVEPTSPPEPKSPLEFLREMAAQNAVFYYNGNEISAAKAIELMESTDHLGLTAEHTGLKRPVVTLSESPIHIAENK